MVNIEQHLVYYLIHNIRFITGDAVTAILHDDLLTACRERSKFRLQLMNPYLMKCE